MPVPTRRLVLVVLASTVVLIALDSGWAFLGVNALVVLAAVVDWTLAVAPSRVEIVRRAPAIVVLDHDSELSWTVTNPTTRRLHLAFADELAPSLRAATRREHLTLAAGESVTVTSAFRPSRRGRFTPTALVVRVTGPLGLASRQATRRDPSVVRVYPPFRSRAEAELRVERARIAEVGLRSAQGRGGGTEFDQLREYAVDDEFRRMDWAATARAGKAIVRTYRAERNQTVISLVDNGRIMAGRVDDVPRVEHAMDAVMMLTAVSTRLGDRAGLVAFDGQVRSVVAPASGRDQLGRVTEAMYQLEPVLTESDYLGAFASTLARFRRRAMLVLFTDLAEQAVAETLLPALPLICRHHLVVVAAVQDPDVVRWARATPTDADGAYRKAAAVSALDERRRTTSRLRGLGATVVDAPPGQLAPLLADAYLRVKAVGRL